MSGNPSVLAALTSAELDSRPERVVVVPVGATEQHGPHLPLETDTLLATAVGEAIVARTPGTLLGPTLDSLELNVQPVAVPPGDPRFHEVNALGYAAAGHHKQSGGL